MSLRAEMIIIREKNWSRERYKKNQKNIYVQINSMMIREEYYKDTTSNLEEHWLEFFKRGVISIKIGQDRPIEELRSRSGRYRAEARQGTAARRQRIDKPGPIARNVCEISDFGMHYLSVSKSFPPSCILWVIVSCTHHISQKSALPGPLY